VAYVCVFTVDEREQALVVRFGKIDRAITEPGLYFKAPFPIDRVVIVEDRILFLESRDKPVQVVDSRRYLVDTITMYRIVDAQRFRETVQASLQRAEDRIETRLEAALKAVYGRLTFEAALSEARADMMREIRANLRPQALEIGIEIVDVRIRRTDLLPEVLRSTYDRMSAERLAEAAEIRAVGTERSLQIRASADRQAVVLVAEAQRDSEIIRGEGDAVRIKTFAEAYSQDPDFFAFYRSLEAYGNSLANSGTTLVLSPDSQFFEFFGNDRGVPREASGDEGGASGDEGGTAGASGEAANAPGETVNE
jgi:membrane protease subunit HflC